MVKRLVVICCILLLPTIAAAEGTMNYGDFWVGGQIGGVFTPNKDVRISIPGVLDTTESFKTDPAFSAGAIVGYNFCMPYRPAWERFFGVALDFQWNQFNQPGHNINVLGISGQTPKITGNQFDLSFLGRLQYPLMGSDRFTRGRIVPFLMFGPSVVWTSSSVSTIFGSASKTVTDFALVGEVGVDFFVCPTVSIGPSFRYRHIFGEGINTTFVKMDSGLNQFMVLGRLAYHF